MGLDLMVVEFPNFHNFGQLVADDEGVWHCDIGDGFDLNNIFLYHKFALELVWNY